MPPLYDRIGRTYATTRTPDPRIARAIRSAIGDATTVVNVGAGAGAYEPDDLDVIAVEPSATMSAQRPPDRRAARVIPADAEALPLADHSVDVALTILSDHHWADRAQGLHELARVARRRVVLVNTDPDTLDAFWLTRDYLPHFTHLVPHRYRARPGLWHQELRQLLRTPDVTFTPLPVPHDCTDGFYSAYWRRPHAYLDPTVRDNISVFHRLPHDDAVRRLADDLATGAWHTANAPLLDRTTLDVGLRIVVAERG